MNRHRTPAPASTGHRVPWVTSAEDGRDHAVTEAEFDAVVAPVGVPVRDTCRCFVTTRIPFGVDRWRPDLDDEPGPAVQAVARYGEDPTPRRAVRTDQGWVKKALLAELYDDATPPIPWERTGRCWAGIWHPVVVCEP